MNLNKPRRQPIATLYKYVIESVMIEIYSFWYDNGWQNGPLAYKLRYMSRSSSPTRTWIQTLSIWESTNASPTAAERWTFPACYLVKSVRELTIGWRGLWLQVCRQSLGENSKLTPLAVSANENVRDEVRSLIRPHLQEGTELLDLKYQPAERRRHWWPFIRRSKSIL